MNELVKQIAEHANLSEDQASQALNAVVEFLRDKVPAPIFSQIESYLGGEVSGETLIGGAKSAMGMFKKE